MKTSFLFALVRASVRTFHFAEITLARESK